MNGEVFRAASDHHGAMAAYCHALANLESFEDLENLTSRRYNTLAKLQRPHP